MKGILRRAAAVLLAAALCLSLAPAARTAGETAAAVRLMRTEGTVSVTNSSGRSLKLLEKMRLYSGYHVTSGQKSYAWVNLDDTKLAKLDAASELELRKSEKVLEVMVPSGNLLFNVTEPLEADETMNICTATMVAGIRGTCGWVEAVDGQHTRFCVLEGSVRCAVTDPVTGEHKSITVNAGEMVDFYVYDKSQSGNKCAIVTKKADISDIPGFVLVDVVADPALCEKIFAGSGLDLRDITPEQAQERLLEDQDRLAKRLGGDSPSEKPEEPKRPGSSTVSPWQPGGTPSTPDTPVEPDTPVTPPFDPDTPDTPGADTPSTPTTSYTVTFNTNGGTLTGSTSITVENGGTVTLPTAPTRTGYTFDGWFTAVEGGTKFTASSAVTENITVYAHWTASTPDTPTTPGGSDTPVDPGPSEPTTYTVTFDANGGTLSGDTSVTVNEGETVTLPAAPTHDYVSGEGYYSFAGWFTAATGGTNFTASSTVTEDTKLYAHWLLTGGFGVTGATSEADFTYADNSLTIMTSTPLTISGNTYPNADSIVIVTGVAADITLRAASINNGVSGTGANKPAITINSAENVTIKLEGENHLYGAGIQKNGDGKLTITGSGSLEVYRGNTDAGIRGNNIKLDGADVYAYGGIHGTNVEIANSIVKVIFSPNSPSDTLYWGNNQPTITNSIVVYINQASSMHSEDAQVYGDVTLSENFDCINLTVPQNATLTILAGTTLTVSGTIRNTGTITNNGTINGTVTNNGGMINGTGNTPTTGGTTP